MTPYYDSLLVKYTARGSTWEEVNRRMRRALQEARIRGVQTNIPFLLNVLTHPTFEQGIVTTGFIDDHPELLKVSGRKWDFASSSQTDMEKVICVSSCVVCYVWDEGRVWGATAGAYRPPQQEMRTLQDTRELMYPPFRLQVLQVEKLVRYMANLAVNGHPPELGANPARLTNSHTPVKPPSKSLILPSEEGLSYGKEGGWRKVRHTTCVLRGDALTGASSTRGRIMPFHSTTDLAPDCPHSLHLGPPGGGPGRLRQGSA